MHLTISEYVKENNTSQASSQPTNNMGIHFNEFSFFF